MTGLKDGTTDKLQARCLTACERLAAQYLEREVRPPEDTDLRAWGQYLFSVERKYDSELGAQYGMFGTAAGIEVLATEGAGQPVLLDACKVLPAVPATKPAARAPGPGTADGTEDGAPAEGRGAAAIHRHFETKKDLLVTAKLCALLDAAVAASCREDLRGALACEPALVVAQLLSLRDPKAGWPDHGGPEKEYRVPNAHATAIALLSLSRTTLTDEQLEATSQAVAWLARPAANLQDQSVATLALAHMAVGALRDQHKDPTRFPEQHAAVAKTCRDGLLDWIGTTRPEEVRRSLEGTEFRLPPSERQQQDRGPDFDFLLYLPHCLVALACVTSPELLRRGRARRFALGVATVVADAAIAKGYFVAAGRGLVATVEHLWLYRLMRAVGTAPTLQPRGTSVAADRIARVPRKITLTVVMLVPVVFAIALLIAADNDSRPAAGTVVTIIGVSILLPILLGVVANFVTAAIRGKS